MRGKDSVEVARLAVLVFAQAVTAVALVAVVARVVAAKMRRRAD